MVFSLFGMSGLSLILAAIGAFLVYSFFTKKKGKHRALWGAAGGVLIAFGLGWLSLSTFGLGTGALAVAPGTTPGAEGAVGICGAGSAVPTSGVSFKPVFIDLWSNAISHDQYAYKLDNNEVKTTASPDTAETLSPGQMITIFSNSNDSTVRYSQVFGPVQIPCSPTFSPTYYTTPYTTSMTTTTFINSDGATKNSGTACDDLSAGQVKNVKMTISGKYQTGLGLSKFAICGEYNNTGQWDDLQPSSGVKIGKPSFLSTTAGNTEPCWEFDALKSNEDKTITWSVDTHDTAFDLEGGNITFTYIGNEDFRKTKNTSPVGYESGFEDTDDNSQISFASETANYCIQ